MKKMTPCSNNYGRAFYVVQFQELPFEGVNDYVCVPYTWVIVRKALHGKSVVTYPNEEDPSITRHRVKIKERCNDEWKFYIASVKYETDSYNDAEHWIAMRNGPSVEEELKTTDAEPKFPSNKKLRSANRNHSSKLNDNRRKPLPKISIKRPALPKSNKQLNGIQVKLDDAAQSSSAGVTDANAEPGSSRQKQSINTQDKQPMEFAQTEITASDFNGTEQQIPSNQVISQFTEQPKYIQEPQISVTPSIEMTFKAFEKRIRLMNIKRKFEIAAQNPSTLMDEIETLCSMEEQSPIITQNQSQDGAQLQETCSGNSRKSTALLRSMAISSQEINDVSRINLKRSQNANIVDSRNSVQSSNNDASASQSRLSSSLGRPRYVRQLDGQRTSPNQHQPPTPPHQSCQNQYIPTNQNNFKQNFLRKSAESNNYEQRPNSRTISMSTPSIGQNSILPSSPLYQASELPQRKKSQPSQQNSQRQPLKPKIRISISTNPKNNRQTPTLQVTKETLSPILTKIINSVRKTLSTTHSQVLLDEQQFQGNHSECAPVNENHPNAIDDTLQTDEEMEEETPSTHHGANSDSDTITDHEVISDHEMPEDEAPIQRTNNFHGTRMTSGNSCADRPIAAQNSTNHQMHSKVVLEQQMLDIFADLFTQMGSTLLNTYNMYSTLRGLMLKNAKTYKKLMGAVKQFNSMQNSAGNGSFSINLKPKVRQPPEERHTEVEGNASSSPQNQHSNGDANRTPQQKHNSWRFVLPPEYDPHDSKWTLNYRYNLPGLVELIPQSGVYVSYGDVKYSQHVSKNCKSLARRLLSAVFNRKALSVCLSMFERAQASDNVGSNVRPELDDHACSVLLNFVLEHGLQRGWNIDLQPILNTLHEKIQEIRFKYGVMVQC